MSNKINDGGRAFPMSTVDGYSQDGMSLRDWFAGQALNGLLAANATYGGKTNNWPATANDAFAFADAMLATREAKP